MTYIKKTLIFFNRRINYLLLSFIVTLILSAEIIDIFSLLLPPEDISEFITKTQIGTTTLFTSLLFLMNLDRSYKKRILHTLILSGENAASVFRFILSFILIVALINFFIFTLSITAPLIFNSYQFKMSSALLGGFKFFLASVYYNSILTVLYFFLKNIFVAIFSFFTIYFIDRRVAIVTENKYLFLPLNTLYSFISENSLFLLLLLFLILFIALFYSQIKRKKRWL